MLKNKQGIFTRFSNSGYISRKNRVYGKDYLRDSFIGTGSVIDAEFVEVSEDSAYGEDYSDETDSELLDNLREYLRTRSKEEITEIFEEIRRTLEDRTSEREFYESHRENSSAYEKMNEKTRMKEIPGRAFRTFSKTACCGKDRILKFSKVVSSKASSIASEGKESVKVSSKILNEKWSNLSPRDRELISDTIITVIELGLLKNSSRGKKAAFVVLSCIYKHKTPDRRDMEEFIEEVSWRLKRRHFNTR